MGRAKVKATKKKHQDTDEWEQTTVEPRVFDFLATPGFNIDVPQNATPEFFMGLFLPDDLLEEIVDRTNSYSRRTINNARPLRKKNKRR